MVVLATGKRVTLHGLQARPSLNGKAGRILLKLDRQTGRCGVRLLDADWKLPLAIKPENLQPLPFEAPSCDGNIHSLLDLPTELLEAVLAQLSARSLLRASSTCALLQAAVVGSDSVWEGVLAHPLVAPYSQRGVEEKLPSRPPAR